VLLLVLVLCCETMGSVRCGNRTHPPNGYFYVIDRDTEFFVVKVCRVSCIGCQSAIHPSGQTGGVLACSPQYLKLIDLPPKVKGV
jgi:hypothetical protein